LIKKVNYQQISGYLLSSMEVKITVKIGSKYNCWKCTSFWLFWIQDYLGTTCSGRKGYWAEYWWLLF